MRNGSSAESAATALIPPHGIPAPHRPRHRREVRTAAANLARARARVDTPRNSVAERESSHDERLEFEAGRSVIKFVLDAESALLAYESLLAQARRSVLAAELALDLSTGCLDAARILRQ